MPDLVGLPALPVAAVHRLFPEQHVTKACRRLCNWLHDPFNILLKRFVETDAQKAIVTSELQKLLPSMRFGKFLLPFARDACRRLKKALKAESIPPAG